jgi:hypothetical protein
MAQTVVTPHVRFTLLWHLRGICQNRFGLRNNWVCLMEKTARVVFRLEPRQPFLIHAKGVRESRIVGCCMYVIMVSVSHRQDRTVTHSEEKKGDDSSSDLRSL